MKYVLLSVYKNFHDKLSTQNMDVGSLSKD